jgi:hypothetical protein
VNESGHISVITELAIRIRSETDTLDEIADRAAVSWQKSISTPDEPAYLDSVALNLHGLYSGIERLFELIARHVDGKAPDGATWHRDLLYSMTTELETIRPAVIAKSTAIQLDELRRFRHLVRNVYAVQLIPDRMQALLEKLPTLWAQTRAELRAFADFLETIGETGP